MKLTLLALLFSVNVMAGERVILKDSKKLKTEVSTKTVLCSAKGYGMEELKINIAALDGWTLFDHTNVRFGERADLPCMTAGICKFPGEDTGLEVKDVIQNNERIETITVKREVVESRILSEEDNEKVCLRWLTEKLNTTVGGVAFHHERVSQEERFPAKACHF